MIGYGLVGGGLLWGFLVGLFHAMGGLPERTCDVVLGAACVGVPWFSVHVARAWSEARLEAAARWFPAPGRLEVLLAAAKVWAPPALGLAGLMAGAASGLLELPARGGGSLLATLPLALVPALAGMVLGELSARQGRGARELERFELLTASLGMVGITIGLRGRAGALRQLGAGLRDLGPPDWVGPASAGQLPLEGWGAILGLLALGTVLALRWAAEPLPDPGPRSEARLRPLPGVGGRAGGVGRYLLRSHLRRWGPAGPLSLVAAAACLESLGPLLLELGRIPGDGPLDFVHFTFLIQLSLGLALVSGVPDWTPPPPRNGDVLGGPGVPQEAEGAYRVGLLRALLPGLVVVVGLVLGGSLDARGAALGLAEGWVMATACVGLVVVAVRLPARPGVGALFYLVGLALLLLPHLVLDLALAWIQEPGGLRIPGLLWAWIAVKALAVVVSTSFGAVIPLVYCKAWSSPHPRTTNPSAPPPPSSGARPAGTP